MSISNIEYPYTVLIYASIIFIFGIVGCIGFIDAKCGLRRNDHFQIMAIVSALFQLLDMATDVLLQKLYLRFIHHNISMTNY